MSNEKIEAVRARKHYYRDNFRRMSNVLMAVLAIIFLLIITIIYFTLTRSEKRYYASSYISELTPLTPVKRGTGLHNPEKEPTASPSNPSK